MENWSKVLMMMVMLYTKRKTFTRLSTMPRQLNTHLKRHFRKQYVSRDYIVLQDRKVSGKTKAGIVFYALVVIKEFINHLLVDFQQNEASIIILTFVLFAGQICGKAMQKNDIYRNFEILRKYSTKRTLYKR